MDLRSRAGRHEGHQPSSTRAPASTGSNPNPNPYSFNAEGAKDSRNSAESLDDQHAAQDGAQDCDQGAPDHGWKNKSPKRHLSLLELPVNCGLKALRILPIVANNLLNSARSLMTIGEAAP